MTPPCGVPASVVVERPPSITPGFQLAADGGREHREPCEQGRMIETVKAPGDVRLQYPLAAVFSHHRRVDRGDGIHRAPSWSEAVGVGLKTALPFRFQGQFDHRLHGTVVQGGNTHSTLHLYPSPFWNL